MTTNVEDRLAAIEDGIAELRLLADAAVKLSKAIREDGEAVHGRLGSLDKAVTRLRADSEIVRGDVNHLRRAHQEVQDGVSSIHRDGMAVSLRTGTIQTAQSEHTRVLREQGEQLGEILTRLDAQGGNGS